MRSTAISASRPPACRGSRRPRGTTRPERTHTIRRRKAPTERMPRRARPWRPEVFVLVVGGGKVGYYLAKELIDSGHEVALMEKEPTRARQIADEIGSIVIPH